MNFNIGCFNVLLRKCFIMSKFGKMFDMCYKVIEIIRRSMR